MTLALSAEEPFARGGNRLCFVHPDHRDRCVKVRRPDFSLEDLRRKKGFPKNLKPLSSFDDNLEEFQVMQQLENQFGKALFELVSRCYGFETTDMGKGLSSELIRDDSGRISHTLKQYLWDHGFSDDCKRAITEFSNRWVELAIPSRDLILHNIVVQLDNTDSIKRLVIIDGLGNPNIFPTWMLPTHFRRIKAQRKIHNLIERIHALLTQRGEAKFPGYHGQLLHEGIDETHNDK